MRLADNPNGESLGGTLSSTASGGVATFTGLTLNKPSGSYSLDVSGGGLTTTSPPSNVAPPTPAQIPAVTGESVVYFQKSNKKGKPQGKKTFTGFNIQFNMPMNPAAAAYVPNYEMKATTITRKKGKTIKSLTPVKFSATYSQSNNSVTLKIIGKSPFAKGGQITILTAPPTGVSSVWMCHLTPATPSSRSPRTPSRSPWPDELGQSPARRGSRPVC